MTVSVDESTTRAQIIYPGDRVDVILVHSPGSGGVPSDLGGNAGPASQMIVRDVRVLAVGSATMDMNRYGTTSIAAGGQLQRPEPPSGETYTLEVSTLDAERIALAAVAGRLTLVVRPISAVSVVDTTSQQVSFEEPTKPVRFAEVMQGLGPTEEELAPPAPTIPDYPRSREVERRNLGGPRGCPGRGSRKPACRGATRRLSCDARHSNTDLIARLGPRMGDNRLLRRAGRACRAAGESVHRFVAGAFRYTDVCDRHRHRTDS